MGYWENLLGYMAAHTYKNIKENERENKKKNQLYTELNEYEKIFRDYLTDMGCSADYFANIESVYNREGIASEIERMTAYKNKLEKFIFLGGEAKNIVDLDGLDEAIAVIEYLGEEGCLYRQNEFIGKDLSFVKVLLEDEMFDERARKLLCANPNNEIDQEALNNVLFENEDHALMVDFALIYDEKVEDFSKYKKVSLKFTTKNILVYDGGENEQILFHTKIDEMQKVNIIITPIPIMQDLSLIQVRGLEVIFSTKEAEKVKEYYSEHNKWVDETNLKVKKLITGSDEIRKVDDKIEIGGEFEDLIVDDVKIWSEEKGEFEDVNVIVTFNVKKLVVFSKLVKQDIYEQEFSENVHIDVEILDIGDENQAVLKFADALFLMNLKDARTVKNYYNKYYEKLNKYYDTRQKHIQFISNQIDGLNNMARNLLNNIDEHILLNHDIVIVLQVMFAYQKFSNVKLWDEEAVYSNENILLSISLIKEAIDSMVELIQERCDDYVEEELRFACWEALKEASITFYSDLWEERYGKYIETSLSIASMQDKDERVNNYIREIVECNEIDDTNVWMIGILTYHIMKNGCSMNELYFPLIYETVTLKFTNIRLDVQKNLFKEKLKGETSKSKTHFSMEEIDTMSGDEFEHFICELYIKMGYKAKVTKQSRDQGLDVLAERNSIRIGIQTKCYSNAVGNSAIQEAVAGKKYYNCDEVMVITNNYFTSAAIDLAKVNDVILWDRTLLEEKINRYM